MALIVAIAVSKKNHDIFATGISFQFLFQFSEISDNKTSLAWNLQLFGSQNILPALHETSKTR